jgi:hypothetical protein
MIENINSYDWDLDQFMTNSNIPSRNQRLSIPQQNLNFINKNQTSNNSQNNHFIQPIDVRRKSKIIFLFK